MDEQKKEETWKISIERGEETIFELDSKDMVLFKHEESAVNLINNCVETVKNFMANTPPNAPASLMNIPATE